MFRREFISKTVASILGFLGLSSLKTTEVPEPATVTEEVPPGVYMLVPAFCRYTRCKTCSADQVMTMHIVRDANFQWDFLTHKCTGHCHTCKQPREFLIWDKHLEGDPEMDLFIPIDQVMVLQDLQERKALIWNLPVAYRHAVRRSTLLELTHVHADILEVVRSGKLFQLNPGRIVALKGAFPHLDLRDSRLMYTFCGEPAMFQGHDRAV